MSTSLPTSDLAELPQQPANSLVQVGDTPDRLTFTLPWKAGLRPLLIVFVVVSVWLSLLGWGVSTRLSEPEGLERIEIAIFALFAVVGFSFLLAGAYSSLQQVTLTVTPDTFSLRRATLFSSEQRSWQRQQLADVFVQHHPGDSDRADSWELQIHPLLGQGDEFHVHLAFMKPDDLRWLATILRQRLHCPGNAPCSPPAGTIVVSSANQGMSAGPGATTVPFQERSEQPASSKVLVEQSVDGLQLTVPPDRLWLGELRAVIPAFAFVTCLFAVAAAIFFWGGWSDDWGEWHMGLTAGAITSCAFPATLLLLWLLFLAYLRRQRAVIRVQDGNLSVTHTGMLRRRSYDWPGEQRPDVRLGHPRIGRLWQMQIHSGDAKQVGLLTGRDPCELQWLATVIRQALRQAESQRDTALSR